MPLDKICKSNKLTINNEKKDLVITYVKSKCFTEYINKEKCNFIQMKSIIQRIYYWPKYESVLDHYFEIYCRQIIQEAKDIYIVILNRYKDYYYIWKLINLFKLNENKIKIFVLPEFTSLSLTQYIHDNNQIISIPNEIIECCQKLEQRSLMLHRFLKYNYHLSNKFFYSLPSIILIHIILSSKSNEKLSSSKINNKNRIYAKFTSANIDFIYDKIIDDINEQNQCIENCKKSSYQMLKIDEPEEIIKCSINVKSDIEWIEQLQENLQSISQLKIIEIINELINHGYIIQRQNTKRIEDTIHYICTRYGKTYLKITEPPENSFLCKFGPTILEKENISSSEYYNIWGIKIGKQINHVYKCIRFMYLKLFMTDAIIHKYIIRIQSTTFNDICFTKYIYHLHHAGWMILKSESQRQYKCNFNEIYFLQMYVDQENIHPKFIGIIDQHIEQEVIHTSQSYSYGKEFVNELQKCIFVPTAYAEQLYFDTIEYLNNKKWFNQTNTNTNNIELTETLLNIYNKIPSQLYYNLKILSEYDNNIEWIHKLHDLMYPIHIPLTINENKINLGSYRDFIKVKYLKNKNNKEYLSCIHISDITNRKMVSITNKHIILETLDKLLLTYE